MKLIIKKPRTVNVDGRKVTITKFEKHLVDDKKDFSTQFGNIKKADLKKNKVKVGKEEFHIMNPTFLDKYKRIKRSAQIITLKDAGSIIANTGINKDSFVLESGTGSGGLTCLLGSIAKKVISYDRVIEHTKTAEENIEKLGLKNVELKKGDIFEDKKVKEKEVDVFILDVTEPWKGIKTALKVLKRGGFLVSYSPNINQSQRFVKSLGEEFLYERTIENIEREWSIKDEVLRPKMKDFGHTAFISFARKLKH